MFQDKIFVGSDINVTDPSWKTVVQPAATKPGSLWYAHEYDTTRWEKAPGTPAAPNPSNIPEFFGDTMLVNGTVFPQATVEARRYRLRMLNACNARFLNLQLYVGDATLDGITLDLTGSPQPSDASGNPNPTFNPNYGRPMNEAFVNAATGDTSWLQIGGEGGFLPAPTKVPSNVPFAITDPDFLAGGPSLDPSKVDKSLIVAPAERPDLIVDFTGYAGKTIILYTDAPAPFPSGDDRNDYFPKLNPGSGIDGVGNPVNGATNSGFGPNTRVLMRFQVVGPTGAADKTLQIAGVNFQGHIDPSLLPNWGYTDPAKALPYARRVLTLNEYHDEFGRLIQILGNQDAANPNAIYGTPYFGTAQYADYPPNGAPASVGATEENVRAGDTEIWEVYNATGDVHPMHVHLVNVQLINREVFDPAEAFLTAQVYPAR